MYYSFFIFVETIIKNKNDNIIMASAIYYLFYGCYHSMKCVVCKKIKIHDYEENYECLDEQDICVNDMDKRYEIYLQKKRKEKPTDTNDIWYNIFCCC